ncbi:MAG: hypothetical protein Q9213_006074 [Squamulea squamosa]
MAEVLNRILSVSVFGHSPKQYVAELRMNSPAIEDLNDQFRNIAPRLQIFSFYETLPTPFGPKNILVVSKDTAILGYPGEVSKSMDADHHNVCAALLNSKNVEDLQKVETLLAVSEKPEDDYLFFRDRWMPGTCQWILLHPLFNDWLRESSSSGVLWLHALPASGKSILSSYIIDYLGKAGTLCEYYYFRFGDQTKRSLSTCLRVLAFQIAQHVPAFREALNRLSDAGFTLEKADARTIWQKVYVSILFKINFATNLFWIVDALDESDTPKGLVEMLSNLSSSKMPIKILIISRQSPDLAMSFERLKKHTTVETLFVKESHRDIRLFVEKEMELMRASEDLKEDVVQKLLAKADGNFLWVHLAVDEILQCHTEDDVQQALDAIPTGITSLYERMEVAITKGAKPSSLALARTILQWAACPRRPVSLDELSQALQPEYRPMLDLGHTISQVCGQFVVVDSASRLVMVHQTARDYLTQTSSDQFSIDQEKAHKELFAKCFEFLDDQLRRRKHGPGDSQPFLLYAATSWAYHLNRISATSENTLTLLVRFLSEVSVLTWISTLARNSELKTLVLASRVMNDFVQRRRRLDKTQSPLLHRLRDLDLVEFWATDLLKIVGKFGGDLLLNPSSIHGEIPPFCPETSMVYQQYGKPDSSRSSLVVTGRSASWDDNLAKIVVGRGIQAEIILCSGLRIAIVASTGQIFLYDSSTFQETNVLPHRENVCTINFTANGDKLVTYGFKTTRVWDVTSGRQLCKVKNPAIGRALHITFANHDTTLLTASNDKAVRIASLQDDPPIWSILDPRILKEETSINSPSCMAFNGDATQIAVAYRKFPLSVWATEPAELIGRCRRTRRTTTVHPVERIVWHPHTGEVLGLYNDGSVFKWHPFEDTHQEVFAAAAEVCCSPEGTVFATSDANGAIKLYNYYHFALIYRLSCESFITGLAFSPDGRRIYDIRGEICNAWEPNALIRLNDITDRASDDAMSESGSMPASTLVSEVCADMQSPITALSAQPRGPYFVAGNDDGVVQVSTKSQSAMIELWNASNFMTIEHLYWGETGKHIACVELGGRVTVTHVEPPAGSSAPDNWAVSPLLSINVDVEFGGIQQVHLSPDSKLLLVVNRKSAATWSVEASSKVKYITYTATSKWINHPSNPDLVLAFDTENILIYDWTTLHIIGNLRCAHLFQQPMTLGDAGDSILQRHFSSDSVQQSLEEACVLRDIIGSPSHLLVPYQQKTQAEGAKVRLRILESSSFSLKSDGSMDGLIEVPVPEGITATIERPLGILPKHGLIFLDKNRRMCSWRLHSGDDVDAVVKYFFLPKDWLNVDCLRLCTLLEDGTLVCPNNGNVSCIKSGLNTIGW